MFMKRLFTIVLSLGMVALMQAQVQFTENFESYTAGDDLEKGTVLSETEWYRCLKSVNQNGVSPVISAGALTYSGYIASGVGNSVILLADDTNDDRISTRRVFNEAITDKLYAAFLVNIESSNETPQDFFTWEASTSSNFARGRVYVGATVEGVVTFGISKNSSTLGTLSGYALNTTYLLVLEYEKVGNEDDGNDDVVRLYVNPDMTKTAAENSGVSAVNQDTNTDYDSGNSKIAINVKQNKIGAKIGSIRVSTTWDGLWSDVPTFLNSVSNEKLSLIVRGKRITNNEELDGELNIYDISGSLCLSEKINAKQTINTQLTKGMYVVKFTDAKGGVKTTKIVL